FRKKFPRQSLSSKRQLRSRTIRSRWECSAWVTASTGARMTRRRFLQDSLSRGPSVSHRPTHLLWFASVWAIKTRRSIGSKKVIANTTAITSPQFGSIRRLLHFMATRVSKRSPRKLFRRHNSRELLPRNERQPFRRAEAAQRLQGCRRLRHCRLAPGSNCHAGFSVPADSGLGGAA